MVVQNRPIDILLVEEHKALSTVLEYCLQHLKPSVEIGVLSDFNTVFKLIEEDKPRMIIVGIGSAKDSVLQCIGNMKQIHPGIAVIVLSSFNSPKIKKAALMAGADIFIPKMEAYPALIKHVDMFLSIPVEGVQCEISCT